MSFKFEGYGKGHYHRMHRQKGRQASAGSDTVAALTAIIGTYAVAAALLTLSIIN